MIRFFVGQLPRGVGEEELTQGLVAAGLRVDEVRVAREPPPTRTPKGFGFFDELSGRPAADILAAEVFVDGLRVRLEVAKDQAPRQSRPSGPPRRDEPPRRSRSPYGKPKFDDGEDYSPDRRHRAR